MTATVYVIANDKGGTGKTTTAANLAVGLADRGVITLLVDLDPQGNAADSLGLRRHVWDEQAGSGRCVSFLLDGSRVLSSQVIPDVWPTSGEDGTGREGLALLPASRRLRDVTVRLALSQVADMVSGSSSGPPLDRLLSYYLAPARDGLGAIVVDCPPNLAVLAGAVYEFADRVIVPVQPQFLAARGAQQHTDALGQMASGAVLAESTLIVPTMVDSRQVMAREVLEYLEERYPGRVADPVPNRVDVKEAPAAGQVVLEYAPASDGAAAYRALVDRLLDE